MSDVWKPEFRQGDTFTFTLTRQIEQLTDNGPVMLPVDVTGSVFTLTLKEDFDDEIPACVFSVTAVRPDPDEKLEDIPYGYRHHLGQVTIELPSHITQKIEAGKYYWDLQEKDVNGNVTTLLPTKENYKERAVVLPDVSAE